ncbi:MAG TPA: hypothetical protein VKU41_32815 [Polyangiaceae bacterium]|nr:hypothetical protein [Polyangiaceae bacterium]
MNAFPRRVSTLIAGLALGLGVVGCPADFQNVGAEGGATTDGTMPEASSETGGNGEAGSGDGTIGDGPAGDVGQGLDGGGSEAEAGASAPDGTTSADGAAAQDGATTSDGMASPDATTAPDGAGGCTGLVCGGACVPSDKYNCGSCGNDCTALPNVNAAAVTCSAGTCGFTCATGFADCAHAGRGCPDNLAQNGNCGACGVTCSSPTPVCAAAGCTSNCAGSTPMLCGTTCTDTQTDSNNCGACGHVCTTTVANATPTCAGGTCGFQCNTAGGYASCGGACVNTMTDPNNCGGCAPSHSCTTGQRCTQGSCACIPCVTDQTNIDQCCLQ